MKKYKRKKYKRICKECLKEFMLNRNQIYCKNCGEKNIKI